MLTTRPLHATILTTLICAAGSAVLAEPPDSPRDRPIRASGASAESEAALSRGLSWLARRQNDDGSWDFDRGYANSGKCTSKCGATAVAILPFLKSGHTHKTGKYKDAMNKGIQFLMRQMQPAANRAHLFGKEEEATFSAMASLVLCEAYMMTNDKRLYRPAQQAVDHIVATQDPKTGGWPPKPGRPADTVVTTRHVLALKSGHMAYLKVPPKTVKGATMFLDRVQAANGAQYGRSPGQRPDATSTAAGLLCRMFLGWKRDNPALKAGVEQLGQVGPWKNDIVYSYFGQKTMSHWGGDEWEAWNRALRGRLVNAQPTSGAEAGSWFFANGAHAADGGRLLQTSMSLMILTSYYEIRIEPAVEEEFKID